MRRSPEGRGAGMRRRIVLLVVATTLLPGCATNGLSFRADERISIVTPADNDRVALPLQIEWTVKDYEGFVAVFLDNVPMRPGRGLLSLVPEDDECRERSVCPDATWLADHRVFVTRDTTLVVERVPDRRGSNRGSDRHQLTIVFLDEDGTRSSEAAFVREFIVERES